jgi:hypothetical protein
LTLKFGNVGVKALPEDAQQKPAEALNPGNYPITDFE